MNDEREMVIWQHVPESDVMERARIAGLYGHPVIVLLNHDTGVITVLHKGRLSWRAKMTTEGEYTVVSDPHNSPGL